MARCTEPRFAAPSPTGLWVEGRAGLHWCGSLVPVPCRGWGFLLLGFRVGRGILTCGGERWVGAPSGSCGRCGRGSLALPLREVHAVSFHGAHFVLFLFLVLVFHDSNAQASLHLGDSLMVSRALTP